MRVFQTEAACARRGRGGRERHAGRRFRGRRVRHRTSRAADPHLHTHVLIANLVHAHTTSAGRRLTPVALYGWAKTIGYLYEAQLRAELTRRLGVAWTPVRNGIADIDGFSGEVLRAFSTRSPRDRDAPGRTLRDQSPRGGGRRLRHAQSEGRRDARLRACWPPGKSVRTALGSISRPLTLHLNAASWRMFRFPVSVGTSRSSISSPRRRGLTARSASFGRREVLQAISAASPNGGDIHEILELADAFLTRNHVVSLDRSGLRTSDVLRRRDGKVVITHADQLRWSTPEMLATEARVIESALNRRRCKRPYIAGARARARRDPRTAHRWRENRCRMLTQISRLRRRGRCRRRRRRNRQDLHA